MRSPWALLRSDGFLHVLACLAVALAVLTSHNRDVRSDPRATLVAGQVLLQQGTFRLDSLGADRMREYGYVFVERNGHYYSRFPLGSTLVSLPVVALATLGGVDLRSYANERLFQVLIAAGIAVATVSLLAALGRFWLSRRMALLLATVTWFGSSFASTEATALWSHDFATLFALLAIYWALALRGRRAGWFGVAIGCALFTAYLCRPTLSLLTPTLLFYLAVHRRRAALQAAIVVAAGLGLFVLGSELVLGQYLPDYYLPQRLAGSDYAKALFGNLLSPSRGLLIFSPIFVLPVVFFRDVGRALKADRALAAIALGWPLAHFVLVSRLRHWWAGYSFGPRFMTDVLPGLFVLSCLTFAGALERKSRSLGPLFALVASWSVLVNTVQGLYSRGPKVWNAEPDIDQHSELVFDWRYPQFMHTLARQRARLAELRSRPLERAGARAAGEALSDGAGARAAPPAE